MRSTSRWGLLAAALAVSAAAGRDTAADEIDPALPSVVVVGAPRGAVTQARLDGRRSGLARTALPSHPAELWRRSLGTLEVPPLVDDDGSLTVALASAEIVSLAPGGKEVWRARMQGGGPASAPVRLSDGTTAVVTTGGVLFGVNPRGKTRFSTQLGARGPDLVAPPVPLDDGGVALVAGRSLLTLDADGAVTTETSLPGHVSSPPVVSGGDVLVVVDDGSVYKVRSPRAPQKVGAFPAMVDGGAVLADERTLLGVVRDRLLALDLRTGTVGVRASLGAGFAVIEGPPVVGADRSVFFATTEGQLFGVDRTGLEIARATVERVAPPPGVPAGYGPGFGPPGGFAPPPAIPSRVVPPLVVDREGHIAFARAQGRFGVVTFGGAKTASRPGDVAAVGTPATVDVVTEHVCTTPLAVLPAGEGRVAVACREGLVAMFGS
jgi:outer membrane protein assembly factor BamB